MVITVVQYQVRAGPLLSTVVEVAEWGPSSVHKAIVAANHHQLKSYRWNSWWSFVVSLHPSGQSQNDVQVLSGSKIFGKTLSSAYIFSIFEKQSRNDSSGIWIGRRYTTRHMMMGPFWALAKAVLLKKPGIRLESREKTWDHIREAQMAASPKLAGDHEKITSSVHIQ